MMTEKSSFSAENNMIYYRKKHFKKEHSQPRRSLLRAAALILTLLAGMALSSPAQAALAPLADRTGFFFDTVITVSMYDTDDETILDKCFDRMEYYESKFSRTLEGSDIWNINHAGGKPVEVSDETAQLISDALVYCEMSDGAFDITIAPVVDLWNFHEDGEHKVPDEDTLKEAVSHVDYHNIEIDGNTVTLKDPEAGIDLGAIAKGYISDGVRDVLKENGCQSALINLGGNVMAVGSKPDGSDFVVGIRKPFGESAYDIIDKVSVSDMSVITSGTYERYFVLDGKLYHHILDPDTGMSTDNGLQSVSILSADGTRGDALSTTCFVLGPEKGMQLIESLDGVEALFIDEEGNLTYSSGWPKE